MGLFYLIRIKFPFFRLVHDFFKNSLFMAIIILILSLSVWWGMDSILIFLTCYGLYGML